MISRTTRFISLALSKMICLSKTLYTPYLDAFLPIPFGAASPIILCLAPRLSDYILTSLRTSYFPVQLLIPVIIGSRLISSAFKPVPVHVMTHGWIARVESVGNFEVFDAHCFGIILK